MSYNPNIPVATDPTLQSQRQILANFQAIEAAFATNHASLVSAITAGAHTVLTMDPQGSDPATSASQVAFYNKLVSGSPQLFYRPNSSQTPIQMSVSSIKVDGSFTQYTFVAGPFYIYGGRVVNPTQGQVVVLSPATNLIHVGIVPTTSVTPSTPPRTFVPPNAAATDLTSNSFAIRWQPNPNTGVFDVYYMAIGL